MSETTTGVIHDIGYQRYTGPRLGRRYAFRSLYTHGVRTAFGLGRSAKAKVFPWIIVGLMTMVAVIFVVVRSQTGQMPATYWEYPGPLTLLIILFVIAIGANTVIGAGSVVTKSIPANVVAVGNPCRVIKQLS